MRTAVELLEVFVVAIILALIVTFGNVSASVQLLAVLEVIRVSF